MLIVLKLTLIQDGALFQIGDRGHLLYLSFDIQIHRMPTVRLGYFNTEVTVFNGQLTNLLLKHRNLSA